MKHAEMYRSKRREALIIHAEMYRVSVERPL